MLKKYMVALFSNFSDFFSVDPCSYEILIIHYEINGTTFLNFCLVCIALVEVLEKD